MAETFRSASHVARHGRHLTVWGRRGVPKLLLGLCLGGALAASASAATGSGAVRVNIVLNPPAAEEPPGGGAAPPPPTGGNTGGGGTTPPGGGTTTPPGGGTTPPGGGTTTPGGGTTTPPGGGTTTPGGGTTIPGGGTTIPGGGTTTPGGGTTPPPGGGTTPPGGGTNVGGGGAVVPPAGPVVVTPTAPPPAPQIGSGTGLCISLTTTQSTGATVRVACNGRQFVSITPSAGNESAATYGDVFRMHFGAGALFALEDFGGAKWRLGRSGTLTGVRIDNITEAEKLVEMLVSF